MKLRLLGTGAADGIPAFYSDSPVSTHARRHGGKDIRTRCGAVIDCCIKIDLPPDTLMQMQRDGLDARDWSCLIFTHSHDDHFAPAELQYALYPFNPMMHLGFTIYGNDGIVAKLREKYPDWPMDIVQTRSFMCFQHEGYAITPIHAYHLLEEDAHNLIIQKDNRTLLYGTDTGIWREETWEFLQGYRVDTLVIECTEGFYRTDYFGHLDIKECLQVIERLSSQSTISSETQIITTHHSDDGGATHAQLEEIFGPHGVTVGFDGLEVEV